MKFNIGETVYLATCDYIQMQITCPICYGKRKVILITGNDDQVELPCSYCMRGYDGPFGYVHEYDYVVKGESFTITQIDIEVSCEGEKCRYYSGTHYASDEELFATKEEALAAAVAIKAILDEQQRTRTEYIKKDKLKSFAWNAGYHLRAAKEHRKMVEYHDGMAVICKAKGKEVGA